jgi:hypothetical protein
VVAGHVVGLLGLAAEVEPGEQVDEHGHDHGDQ